MAVTSLLLAGLTLAMAAQDGVPRPAAPPTEAMPPTPTATVPPVGPASTDDALPPLPDPPAPAIPGPSDPIGPSPGPGRSMADDLAAGGVGEGTQASLGDNGSLPISGNPGAVNIVTGTGALGRFLGLTPESGLRLGGVWIGDANGLLTGGLKPGRWGFDGLTLVNFSLDTEKRWGWKGGLFGIQFLQFTGTDINGAAGTFPGYNSLQGAPPLTRQEIYQLWFRQSLFEDKFIVRMGKLAPSNDFGNVVRPVPVREASAAIPAVTGLIMTSVFINPTMIGVMPGYYNSAVGMTATFTPTERTYLNYGIYDGAGAGAYPSGQTGLDGPIFNGSSFQIGEVGFAYRAGPQKKPGNFGVGVWGQIGQLRSPPPLSLLGTVRPPFTNAQGVYLFGAHWIWFRNPGVDNSGVSGFYQFGANDSNALPARYFVGGGLTAFGLVPGRPADSFGFGVGQTWLNTTIGAASYFHMDDNFAPAMKGKVSFGSSQLMFGWYYQMKVFDGCFFQPNLTYIPTPAVNGHTPGALAITLRLTVLF